MYEAKIEGKTVRLRNRDYERILDRIDVSKLDEWGMRYKQCSLCARLGDCDDCPFHQFATDHLTAGCWVLVKRFFRSKGLKPLIDMNEYEVYATTPKQRERLEMLHDAFVGAFWRV